MSGPRNLAPLPYLACEGTFEKPIKVPSSKRNWADNLTPFERLNYHHTLSSVRRYVHFKPLPELVIHDALDIPLEANYDQGTEKFAEKVDTLLQRTTIGTDIRRRLRNVIDTATSYDGISKAFEDAYKERNISAANRYEYQGKGVKYGVTFGKYNDHHVLHVGGCKPRRHPSNVKLMNSSFHSPQTNAGYARQNRDGNLFQY